MSTFSTPGGLYERAARAARLPPGDGKKLFSWSFFERRRGEALAFLAGVAAEAAAAAPTPAHTALAALARAGALERHFTLNIDGLARAAGLSTWHARAAPGGTTVELHGCVSEVVCPDCGVVDRASEAVLASARARADTPCPACTGGPLRPRVLLYGDAEDGVITPPSALDLLEAAAPAADLVLWVGISFEQSASAAYFRDVRRALAAASRGPRGQDGGGGAGGGGSDGGRGRDGADPPRPPPVQAIVNPAASDAAFNLATALHYSDELGSVLEIAAPADAVLPPLVAAIVAGLGRPSGARVGAAASPVTIPRPPSTAAHRHGALAASEDEGEEGVAAAGKGGGVGGGGETALTADARA
jgi:NAD-dependent SIR2 family protein deacetylase